MAVRSPPSSMEYLDWSEVEVTFSREDHPPCIPQPGNTALVVDTQIRGFMLNKVFIDSGSGLNIIYADTLRKMNRSTTKLAPTKTTFHGIIPGKAATPLSKVNLDVVFRTPDNFRRERIDFEVVNWPSQYHMVLSRVALARFMAVPHYAYLKLKMPGPNGVITISGSFLRSDHCDHEFHKISESLAAQNQASQAYLLTDDDQNSVLKKRAIEATSGTDSKAEEAQAPSSKESNADSASSPTK
ncbi:uncharacterized protein LOC104584952 [Brachypodium distachyon]|uniref:uncharacterized protein LOC104584952 n=1 Tax=Brachypodium distachyon TaxID=15368 RepID=UPI0005300095|nr:uncharacterized protein LOC104584952 [Brachypodium distachyon]|eukprot:XP_010239105.1 uncharacterized protein LOC104584952 [Brachypodium distachyon]